MDLQVNVRLLDIMRKTTEGKAKELNYVKFEPWKKRFPEEGEIKQKFPRSTPEKQGIPSGYIEKFINAIIDKPETCVHSFMILRKGNVIAEGSFAPYKEEYWHVSNSLCKSITCLAIGIAIGEGRLKVTDSVVDLLKGRKLPLNATFKKNITVKHLLTMSSGLGANEAVSATENDWTRTMLDSGQLFAPGTHFHYNSMNTYLLAVILNEVTGQTLMEYIKPRLLIPMGIDKIAWGKSPEGIEKGGWGMFICIEDMAKFGQLCLQKGEWNGKQLVPAKWIEEMSKYRIDSTAGKGLYGYGYQVWMGKRQGSFIFNGMFGQIVHIIPDLDMVFAFTGGSDNAFRDNETNFLIEKFFDDKFQMDVLKQEELKPNGRAYKGLKRLCENLSYETAAAAAEKKYDVKYQHVSARKMKKDALKFCGKKYKMPVQTVGLMPMYMQYVHNNLSEGISRLELKVEKDSLKLVVKEGKNVNIIPVGFEAAEYSVIHERGEEYNIATTARFCMDENLVPVLKIRMDYIEAENYRTIAFYFEKNQTKVEFNENPSVDMIIETMDAFVPKFGGAGDIINNAMDKLDMNLVGYALKYMFKPVLTLEEIK